MDVQPGEVLALTGSNGSGKTTLLRILATLLRPTRGTASIFGRDVERDRDEIRGDVGFLGHASALYDDLTAAENLSFAVRMAGRDVDPAAVAAALERVGLLAVGAEPARGFSAGMRRRLGLARLMLRPPRLLLLDEPYTSFDSDGIAVVNGFVMACAAEGGVVVLTTHDMTRALDVATRRAHLVGGRLAP